MSAIIAIVGRPNVGKSTLFNRILRKRVAITSEVAGTTRDRIIQQITLEGLNITLVDTGGLEYGKKENIEADIQSQAKLGIEDASIIYFVLDATEEITRDDFLAANLLRKSKKEVILILNKCDNQNIEQLAFNFYELGFDNPITISAAHNSGIDKVLKETTKKLKEMGYAPTKKEKNEDKSIAISILGRPNAGKSSLVNALCGKEKIIVSDIAGTTRDATDTHILYEKQKINLIDTAGIRRRGKIEKGIERFSIMRCLDSINRSDVCVLLLNYEGRISKQDCHIAEFILNEGKGLILAVNKCDLMEEVDEDRAFYTRIISRKFSFIPWASLIFVSAKDRKNIKKILEISIEISKERKKRIRTPEFNDFLQKITHKHLPSGTGKHQPKIYYATQTGINPPEFTFFMNDPERLHFSYRRYIENEIRKEYGFNGTAVNLIFKKRPQKEKKKD